MTTPQIGRRHALAAGAMGVAGSLVAASAEAAWTRKAWGATENANVKVVNAFIATLDSGDLEAHLSFLAPDAKVRNLAHTPAPALDPAGLRKMLANFLKPGVMRVKTLETIAQGPMVINTRIDRINFPNGTKDLHYMGVFFLQNGKIKEWNDYEVSPDTPVKPGQPL
jgi:limonene-1,2-epoxide hydrolase